MYGMLNRPIEEMILAEYGAEVWDKIRALSGVDVEVFISNADYPDWMTLALARAAATVLGTTTAAFLHAYGSWWIERTAMVRYRDLMVAGGSSLGDFLGNLPDFHARVSLIFPHLRPPVFQCLDRTPTSVHIRYESERHGLAPLLVGFFDGLGKVFSTEVTVTQVTDRSVGAISDEFVVSW